MVTPSGALGNGGKVKYGPSTGLTKFSVEGSGIGRRALVDSVAILKVNCTRVSDDRRSIQNSSARDWVVCTCYHLLQTPMVQIAAPI